MSQKKKSCDSMNASTCSDVSTTHAGSGLALAQSENDPRFVCDLGSDNCAYSTVVHKAYHVSFGGCVIKPMCQHTVSVMNV